jgi:hypothetical protein
VLAQTPVLAHPGHAAANGNVWPVVLLVVAAALLAGGLAVLVRRGVKPAAWALLGVGVGIGLLGFAVDGGEGDGGDAEISALQIDPSAVELSIVEPAPGATVPAGEPITVQVAIEGGSLATSAEDTTGGHLHLAVDGSLVQMQYADQAEVTLEPGRHTLTVEYVDNLHVRFEPAVEQTIEVRAQ